MLKERPILFSAPMVRALLAGTKTQTRRVVKCKPWQQIEERDDGTPWPWMHDNDRDDDYWLPCPYGQPGDRLWVREAWRTDPQFDYLPPRDLDPAVAPVQYEAGPHADVLGGKLRPSMFMPRWACRLVLPLESVRVERLQDISEADALAEGVTNSLHLSGGRFANENYAHLWDTINGEGAWAANPWVWCLSFTAECTK